MLKPIPKTPAEVWEQAWVQVQDAMQACCDPFEPNYGGSRWEGEWCANRGVDISRIWGLIVTHILWDVTSLDGANLRQLPFVDWGILDLMVTSCLLQTQTLWDLNLLINIKNDPMLLKSYWHSEGWLGDSGSHGHELLVANSDTVRSESPDQHKSMKKSPVLIGGFWISWSRVACCKLGHCEIWISSST